MSDHAACLVGTDKYWRLSVGNPHRIVHQIAEHVPLVRDQHASQRVAYGQQQRAQRNDAVETHYLFEIQHSTSKPIHYQQPMSTGLLPNDQKVAKSELDGGQEAGTSDCEVPASDSDDLRRVRPVPWPAVNDENVVAFVHLDFLISSFSFAQLLSSKGLTTSTTIQTMV